MHDTTFNLAGVVTLGWLVGLAAMAAFVGGCGESPNDRVADRAATGDAPIGLHPVLIRRPSQPPRVDLGEVDGFGRPITAACSTCHATRRPDESNRIAAELTDFHQGLTFQHGSLSCFSCHHPGDYDALRLANGTPVPFVDVMTLCSQCHGPQHRDYLHGSHGGMTGYWDLSRGPRTRNNCIDCHDPHAPVFPRMQRTFRPIDRFLETGDGHGR